MKKFSVSILLLPVDRDQRYYHAQSFWQSGDFANSLFCLQTFKKVNADSDRDYWMKADEAHKYGMVDEVLNKWYEWGRNFMFLLR